MGGRFRRMTARRHRGSPPSARQVLAWLLAGVVMGMLLLTYLFERQQRLMCELKARMDAYDRSTGDAPPVAPPPRDPRAIVPFDGHGHVH